METVLKCCSKSSTDETQSLQVLFEFVEKQTVIFSGQVSHKQIKSALQQTGTSATKFALQQTECNYIYNSYMYAITSHAYK